MSIKQLTWDNTIGSVSPFECCGATYTDKPKPNTRMFANRLGIRVANGIVGKEMDTETFQITHVKTRNGDLTISVRKKDVERATRSRR